MMKLSQQLNALSDHVRKTEFTVTAARANDRGKLEARRESLMASATASAVAAKREFADVRWGAGDQVDGNHSAINVPFAELHRNVEARRAECDAKRAAHLANDAEQDACDAISLALIALDQADFAIADAAIARTDADELTRTAQSA